MRTFRLILTFYKSFFFISLIISLICMYITYLQGFKALSSMLLVKSLSLGLIFLFISRYKRRDFFYYQNLGISKSKVWTSSLGLDILLFIVLIVLTLIIR